MQDSNCEKKSGINYCKAMKVGHDEDFITIPTKVYETLMGCSGDEDEFMQVSTVLVWDKCLFCSFVSTFSDLEECKWGVVGYK